jgi:uncharacterized membrane protein YphA (DoxX/SURF4 family)
MIRELIQRVIRGWNQFFFEPTSTATMGIYRIFFGVVVFISTLGKLPYRNLFYGDSGIVSYSTISHFFPGNAFLYFRWVPGTDPGLLFYFLAILLACVLLTFGVFTRLSSIAVFLGIISLSNRNFFVDNAGDDFMRINALILMFSQAGAAYSFDRWLRVKRGKEGSALPLKSPWAQRLLQLQLAYLYLDTFFLKLSGPGWQDGTALYYALHYVELQRFTFKYLFYYLWQIKLMTWGTLVIEFSGAILIWFRKLRYPILLLAFCLHVGINLTMQFPVFQYVMMVSLISFIYPEDMEMWVSRFLRTSQVIGR